MPMDEVITTQVENQNELNVRIKIQSNRKNSTGGEIFQIWCWKLLGMAFPIKWPVMQHSGRHRSSCKKSASSQSLDVFSSTFRILLLLMAFKNQEAAPRALVVEDVKLDRIILSAMLRKYKCKTTVAHNGKEAMDLFLEGNTFDIVFCDKDMPVMTGPEAVAKIRALGAHEVKIIGVSADSDGMKAFMSAGADVFVPKPMKISIIDSLLQEVIKQKNMRP
ncbi:hypothetical protein EJB05_47295, partial [Eragrostis curvula]